MIPADTWYWVKAYQFFKNGMLPSDGGWMQQSNKFIDVMSFLDGEIEKHKKEMAKDGRK